MTDRAVNTSKSLFDTAEGWRSDPLRVMVDLLRSPEYGMTAKPRVVPSGEAVTEQPKSEPLSDDSIKVYSSMLGKFIKSLKDQKCEDILSATPAHIDRFFRGPGMCEASRETTTRYRRLLERTYTLLSDRGFIDSNPVLKWFEDYKAANSRRPEEDKPQAAPDLVDITTVRKLRSWLRDEGLKAIAEDNWRRVRDIVMCLLSLSSGVRSAELVRMKRSQITLRANAPAGQQVHLEFSRSQTAATAKAHNIYVHSSCADLFQAWLDMRWKTGLRATASSEPVVPAGEFVFVGLGREGGRTRKLSTTGVQTKGISVTLVNVTMRVLSEEALRGGVISLAEDWVLCTGSRGLRRAYTLSELQNETSAEQLRQNLGLHLRSSVQKYEVDRQLANRPKGPRA